MTSQLHHIPGPRCPLCDEKRATLHPELAKWWDFLKTNYPETHMAWGYRDEENQNRLFAEGKTKARFPNSRHNVTKDGKPCSEAFDCFVILDDGVARFPPKFYFDAAEEFKAAEAPIQWAGEWKSFRESDHYQLELKP